MSEKLDEKYFDLLCGYIRGRGWLDDRAIKIINKIRLAGCHAQAEADKVAVDAILHPDYITGNENYTAIVNTLTAAEIKS